MEEITDTCMCANQVLLRASWSADISECALYKYIPLISHSRGSMYIHPVILVGYC